MILFLSLIHSFIHSGHHFHLKMNTNGEYPSLIAMNFNDCCCVIHDDDDDDIYRSVLHDDDDDVSL